jgi:hypothetical protein
MPVGRSPSSSEHSHGALLTLQTLDGGRKRSGVFAIDLTLAELKELYAVQTFRFRDHSYDARYRCVKPFQCCCPRPGRTLSCGSMQHEATIAKMSTLLQRWCML